MASKTRASSPGGTTISLSSAASVSFTVSASATDSSVSGDQKISVKRQFLDVGRAVRADDDAIDARLRLAQFGFAMLLQERAALVGCDGIVELGISGLETLDDSLQLGQ